MNYRLIIKNIRVVWIVFGLLLVLSNSLFGQDQIRINGAYSGLSWQEFVSKVEQDFSVRFFYLPDDIPELKISFDGTSVLLSELLEDQLNPLGIFVSTDKNGNIFLAKNNTVVTALTEDFFNTVTIEDDELSGDTISRDFLETTKKYVAQTIIIGDRQKGVNKRYVTLSGYATNRKTGEVILGATIIEESTGHGTVTDVNGFYSMILSKGEHLLTVSSVNLKEKQIKVNMLSDGELNLVLDDKIVLLADVVINAEVDNIVKGTQMGLEKIEAKSVKEIPIVFGEKDIFKVALLLPGVQSVGEGASGFNVRGSPTDQNIFYINQVPVYNTSHAAGFFSAFNSDVIDEFTFYKNSIPINYGGRISSVFDIKARQASKDRFIASGGISPITARLMIGTPIIKEKASILVGARSTYSDWILNFVDDPDIKNSNLRFADVVANLSYQIKENHQLNVFTYFSYDKMDLATQTDYDYQNLGGSVMWKHFFRKKNSLELSMAYSRYKFHEKNYQVSMAAYEQSNMLDHTELKASTYIRPNEDHTINFGVNSILYQIDRGQYDPLGPESLIEVTDIGEEQGIETGFFVSDEWKLTPRFIVSGGVRFNLFNYLGPQEVYQYKDDLPKTPESIVDTLTFGDFENVKTYSGLDVRLGANYMISDRLSLKVAYNRMHQYIYMLSNTIAISPDYKWKLVDYNTVPIVGDQVSVGMYSNLHSGILAFSVEAYYKKLQNVVEVKDGGDISFNEHTEWNTLQGNMNTYGIEFMLQKPAGDLTGWINYTFSRSKVLVDSEYDENKINFGQEYPSNYDKPHVFNIVANYRFSRRVSLSGNMVYSTGRPVTYPTSVYYLNDIPTLNYSLRNEYRLPDYFRMDMALSIEGNLKKHKPGHSSWVLSVYNLFGRDNVYSVYFVQEGSNIKAYKLSIFGVPIFSITYNIKLGNYASE